MTDTPTPDLDLLAYAKRQTERHDGHANDETVEVLGYDLNILLATITDLAAEVERLRATLRDTARTLDVMKSCRDCAWWASKGNPFCTIHALRLGGLLGEYVLAGGDQPTSQGSPDPCPACNGDGESDESPLVPCPTCLGTGTAPAAPTGDDQP